MIVRAKDSLAGRASNALQESAKNQPPATDPVDYSRFTESQPTPQSQTETALAVPEQAGDVVAEARGTEDQVSRPQASIDAMAVNGPDGSRSSTAVAEATPPATPTTEIAIANSNNALVVEGSSRDIDTTNDTDSGTALALNTPVGLEETDGPLERPAMNTYQEVQREIDAPADQSALPSGTENQLSQDALIPGHIEGEFEPVPDKKDSDPATPDSPPIFLGGDGAVQPEIKPAPPVADEQRPIFLGGDGAVQPEIKPSETPEPPATDEQRPIFLGGDGAMQPEIKPTDPDSPTSSDETISDPPTPVEQPIYLGGDGAIQPEIKPSDTEAPVTTDETITDPPTETEQPIYIGGDGTIQPEIRPAPTGPEGQTPGVDVDPASREKEDAEIARLNTELGLKRDEYIKAREVTRSFWKNMWGNIRAFGSEDRKNPAMDRNEKREAYEAARNELIKLRAETAAKRKGLAVPEMPAALADGASEDEKAEHAAKTTKAEADKKKYDQEVLNNAINQIALEKYTLAKADFENMNRNGAVIQALDKLRKNPAVRVAIAGGLLASTATGFIPGVVAFGAAQTGLGVMGMKGMLDFGAEQYAGKFGDEKKNLNDEQLMKMDQDERNRRDAALLEMGIKNNKEPGEAEKKIEKMSQERIKVAVTRMMERGEVKGDTTQERTAAVLAAILKEGNLNMAIDSKINKNRDWNAARWVTAMAGTAAISTFMQMPEGAPTEAVAAEAPTPVVETSTPFTPWENASGDGYSWKGWQEGELRKQLQFAANLQGEADVQNWINTHPTEYANARAAITDAMTKANPGLDVSGEGVLKQEYRLPNDLRSVVGNAIRSATNAV